MRRGVEERVGAVGVVTAGASVSMKSSTCPRRRKRVGARGGRGDEQRRPARQRAHCADLAHRSPMAGVRDVAAAESRALAVVSRAATDQLWPRTTKVDEEGRVVLLRVEGRTTERRARVAHRRVDHPLPTSRRGHGCPSGVSSSEPAVTDVGPKALGPKMQAESWTVMPRPMMTSHVGGESPPRVPLLRGAARHRRNALPLRFGEQVAPLETAEVSRRARVRCS